MEAKRYILEDAVEKWLENFKKNSVKPATYDRLKISFSLFRKYPIARMNLEDIRCDDVQLYLNQVVFDGYSLSTVKKQYTLLTSYFRFAFSKNDISSPIYIGTELPREEQIKKQAKKMEVYSAYEQEKLVEVFRTLKHPAYGAAMLMLECGLRIGEVLSLTWDDINWNRKCVTISKTLVKLSMSGGRSFVQNSPKSATSRRTIPLSKKALEVLRCMYTGKREMFGFVFPSDKDFGLPMSFATVRYYLRQACDKAGVEYKGNHIFRHTFATNCYYKGCNVKLLSRLLGHSDVSITYNTYIHLYGDALEEMRTIID